MSNTERFSPALWLLIGPHALLDHFGPDPDEESGHHCYNSSSLTIATRNTHVMGMSDESLPSTPGSDPSLP